MCRRAAHPGNMRGKLVSSAALLIRLLPLAQLLLMRFLYFVVSRGPGQSDCAYEHLIVSW
jgi:hypothetical protein